ncbi:MAG: alpha/beta hydrolase [Mycoplasmataceae bacterium]|jgi:pimeloyl-ACP methyl ester carboxylesterase|nr:alpha/beta hydrolase [Mycoplasmataceae bacterium]
MIAKDVVFIHGITSFGNSHFRTKRALEAQGYVFHNPDLPGHGDNKTSIPKFNEIIQFVIDYINKNIGERKFIIFGHSMGGGIAQYLCKIFNDQISLVILECPLSLAILSYADNEKYKHEYENNALNDFKVNENSLSSKNNIASLAGWLGSKISYLPLLLEIISPKTLELFASAQSFFENKKVLLVLGKNDRIVPTYSTLFYFKKICKNITVNLLNTNHNPFNEDTENFNKLVINYLKENN